MKLRRPSFVVAAELVLLSVLSPCAAAGPADRPSREELGRAVDAIFSEWTAPGSPGAAVLLTDHGEVVLERCYGLADVEHAIPITPATRFELASVSKTFTAFAALLLEQSGALSLGDDVRTYLPELPDRGVPITVADLVHHTSGLSDYVRVLPYAHRSARSGFATDDLVRLAARQRVLEFPPGTKWSYSNTNYALLAEIVARVTGRPFGEWVHANVFTTLGMRDSSFPADGTVVLPGRANAYHRLADGTLRRSLVEDFHVSGPAHAFATLGDMARWVDNLRTGTVGGAGLIARMQEGATLASGERTWYGAGLGTGEYRGLRTVGHSGQTGAFMTELVYCPEAEVGVVVLANAGWLRADRMARGVLDVYLGDRLEPLPVAAAADTSAAPGAPAPFSLDPAGYERFLGGYRLDADPSVLVAVAREGDWLVGALVGMGIDLFRPVAQAEFENRHRNCRLAFAEDPDGAVGSVTITLRGEEMRATRVELPAGTAWTDECLGTYYSDELDAAWEIDRTAVGLLVRGAGPDSRALQPVDADVLAGGVGILTLLRDGEGRVVGLDFAEPEDLGARRIRFARIAEPTAVARAGRDVRSQPPDSAGAAALDPARELAVIEQVIRDNIGWARTEDRALLESTMAQDERLVIVNPGEETTVGWQQFVTGFDFWMDPRFKAVSVDIRDLRVDRSLSGDVAWWSCVLDDLAEWDGRPVGWRDTRWTGVMERRDGRWRIAQMHFSFARPSGAAAPAATTSGDHGG